MPIFSENTGDYRHLTVYELIISIMIACFTLIIFETVRSYNPAWNGGYLILLAFLISLESHISRNIIKKMTILNYGPFLFRVSEWIVLLVLIKASGYLFTNPGQFLPDLKNWGHDFSSFFINNAFIFIFLFLFLIWLVSGILSGLVDHFKEDYELLDLERQGFVRGNRSDSHRKLIGWIFGLGSCMIFLTTICNINLPFLSLHSNSIFLNVFFILFFFLLGFILLAKSQSAIQKAQWYIRSIPVNPSVSFHWITYSILFLATIALIAIFLPTRYSLSILDLLHTLFGYLLSFFSFLEVLVIGSIIWLLSSFSRLFGQTTSQSSNVITQITPFPTAIPTPTPSANSWVDLLKSILFWVIFIVVIFFAFFHYFSQRQKLFSGLRSFSPWKWLKGGWIWLWKKVNKTSHFAAKIISSAIAQINLLTKPLLSQKNPSSFIKTALPPKYRVIFIYLSWIHWNSQNGIRRKNSQTPLEYAQELSSLYPEIKYPLNSLTNHFIEARYTNHPITSQQAIETQSEIDAIQKELLQVIDQNFQAQD